MPIPGKSEILGKLKKLQRKTKENLRTLSKIPIADDCRDAGLRAGISQISYRMDREICWICSVGKLGALRYFEDLLGICFGFGPLLINDIAANIELAVATIGSSMIAISQFVFLGKLS